MKKCILLGLLALLLAAGSAEANGVAFRGRVGFGFNRGFAVVTPRVRVVNVVGFADPGFASFNSFGAVGYGGGFVDPGFVGFNGFADPGFAVVQPGFGFAVRRRGFAFGFGSPFVGFQGFNRFGFGGFHRGRVFIR